ncbi:MAG TPA: Trm112 family protein, partial [Polyangiaceae bacterium]
MSDNTSIGQAAASARKIFDLVCPRCRQPVEEGSDTMECTGCGRTYPKVGGIPVLVPEPEALIAHWCKLLQKFDEDMRRGLDELLVRFTADDLPEKTHTRLKTLHHHLGRHRARLLELLTDAGLVVGGVESSSSGDGTLNHGSLLDYYAQIHRDWGWESEGCREALEAAEAVGSILADHELGRFLVLGAGACRLTRDLHHRYRATATLALDVDPLPFVVAQQLLQGRTVRLYEFPPWPLDSTKLFADRS